MDAPDEIRLANGGRDCRLAFPLFLLTGMALLLCVFLSSLVKLDFTVLYCVFPLVGNPCIFYVFSMDPA